LAYDGTLKFDTSLDASGFQVGASKLGDIVNGRGSRCNYRFQGRPVISV
jgi:hypothetical protein